MPERGSPRSFFALFDTISRPLEMKEAFERGIGRSPESANHRWESVPTVDDKAGKTNAPRCRAQGALEV